MQCKDIGDVFDQIMHFGFEGRGMLNRQHGVTLIELMIVVAIIGVMTMFAIPVYTDFGIRAQISEGLNLTGSAKAAVTEYYQDRRVFPTDNAQAGLEPPGNITGKYVDSVAVNGAVISIQYGKDAHAQINGQTITLTAIDNSGSIRWVCANGGFIRLNQLPPVCR